MKIEGNQIHISVTELSKLGGRSFPFSVPGPSLKRAAMGRQAQELYQKEFLKKNQDYETEISIFRRDILGSYEIFLGGRIDGRFWEKGKLYIDEIKSVTLSAKEFNKLEEETFINHRNQLALYQWLAALDFPGIEIESRLIYINLVTEEIRILPLNLHNDKCENIYLAQSSKIISIIEENINRQKQNKVMAKHLRWPYKNKREIQNEMMQAISQANDDREAIMVNAPTGTGKTLASLYPTIHFALENNKKVFFLTSKTTQQKIAVDTIKQILPVKSGIISLRLKATRKMCANDHYFCNELVCPYAKDFQTKLEDEKVIEKLLTLENIEPEEIFRVAKDAVVCPAETMLQLVPKADILVGDFNYVFDPVAYLKSIFSDDYSRYIPIIDEAHNLYPRIQDTYSPALLMKDLEELYEYCNMQQGKIYPQIEEWLKDVMEFFKEMNFRGEIEYAGKSRFLPEIDLRSWQEKGELLDILFIEYFLHKIKNTLLIENDPIDNFYFNFSFFISILAMNGKEFYRIFEAAEGGKLQIYCTDPGKVLRNRMAGFESIIAMSATLKPFDFFATMTGFNPGKVKTIDLPSPFDKKNLLVIINNKVSTRYKDRMRNALRIANYINKAAAPKKGNYLIFFPSFEFLELCWPFIRITGFKKVKQPNISTDDQRSAILEILNEGSPTLLFAVMGGVFSEGVDYPGQMAIGAFLISPGLPPFNFYRELQKHYFDKEYGEGQKYAYIYPGMNKVIQSAGRVIRTETDKGVIFLLGNRFSEMEYQELFPDNWFRNGDVLEAESFSKILKDFWVGK